MRHSRIILELPWQNHGNLIPSQCLMYVHQMANVIVLFGFLVGAMSPRRLACPQLNLLPQANYARYNSSVIFLTWPCNFHWSFSYVHECCLLACLYLGLSQIISQDTTHLTTNKTLAWSPCKPCFPGACHYCTALGILHDHTHTLQASSCAIHQERAGVHTSPPNLLN